MDSGVTKIYRIAHKLYKKKVPILPKVLKLAIRVVCAATIPYTASIGEGTRFPHAAQGVVIHDNAVIGKNCTILPNVVIGGKKNAKHAPIIGDNVLIGAGAIVIGGVSIGNNVTIGAGAVVLEDIPDYAVAVGNPAVIKKYVAS